MRSFILFLLLVGAVLYSTTAPAAFKYANRVKETTTTTGTGTYSLAGPATGYQSFVAGIGDANTTAYFVTDGTSWEAGIGTVTDATPDTLSRGTILSSTTGSAISWGAGAKTVFCEQPAERIPVTWAAGDGRDGASLSGDSATGYFPAGQIEAARGGTNQDSSGWTGLVKATSGVWSAETPSAVRTYLGLVPGTDVQAYSANLNAIAGLTSAADKVPYFTGSGTAATSTLSSVARTFIALTTTSALFDNVSGLTTLGDVIYGGASGTRTRLAGNTTATKKFLRQTGNGSVSAAPAWDTVTASDVGLGSVENTALSTWQGTAAINTVGNVGVGTWNATPVGAAYGGTGTSSAASTGVPRVSTGTWTFNAGILHLASSTSADLRTVLSDETGSGGAAVFATSPTISAPILSGNTSIGAATGVTVAAATGMLTMTGKKTSGNNENLTWDFETLANQVLVDSTTGVTAVWFNCNVGGVRLYGGAGAEFTVGPTGDITRINNVVTSFPSVQGAAGTVLENNGSGTLTWGTKGGRVLLSSQTASNSAFIAFTSGINSTYTRYVIEVTSLIPATDGTDFACQISTDGGSSYKSGASDYVWGMVTSVSSGSALSDNDTADPQIYLNRIGNANEHMGNASGEGANSTITLFNPAGTSLYQMIEFTTSYIGAGTGVRSVRTNGSGTYTTAGTAVNAIKFYMSSGNITSGTFRLYGIP